MQVSEAHLVHFRIGTLPDGLLKKILKNHDTITEIPQDPLFFSSCTSKPISRVMSLGNHLSNGHLLPVGSSDPPESTTGSRIRFLSRSCFGWGLHVPVSVTRDSGSLLHCLSTLTRKNLAVSLCCTSPWESPPPDVIRHPALRSPDFPHLAPFGPVQPRLPGPACRKRNIRQLYNLLYRIISFLSVPKSQIRK